MDPEEQAVAVEEEAHCLMMPHQRTLQLQQTSALVPREQVVGSAEAHTSAQEGLDRQ